MVWPKASSCPGPIPGVWRRRNRLPGPDKGPPPQLLAERKVSAAPSRNRGPVPATTSTLQLPTRARRWPIMEGGPMAGSGAFVVAGEGVISESEVQNPRCKLCALCDLLCAQCDALRKKRTEHSFLPPGQNVAGGGFDGSLCVT